MSDLFAQWWLDAVMLVALDEIGRGGPRRVLGPQPGAEDLAELRAKVRAAVDRLGAEDGSDGRG